MFVNVERYVDFLAKNKISQQQFLLLYLIKFRKESVMKEYMMAFPTHDGSMIGKESRQDLIDRGFLKHDAEKGVGISAYETTQKFNDLYVNDTWEAADEFWKKYPGFVRIGGKDVPLTNVDRYQFQLLYGERIRYSVDEHKEVLADLEYGIKRGLVRQGIEKFVKTEMWQKIRELRKGETQIAELSATDREL